MTFSIFTGFKDLKFSEKQGFYTIGTRPNIMNILTPQVKNACMWHDGTLRPMKGHNGLCRWHYDGQVFVHD